MQPQPISDTLNAAYANLKGVFHYCVPELEVKSGESQEPANQCLSDY